jgi:ABC-type sulfate transport system permease component
LPNNRVIEALDSFSSRKTVKYAVYLAALITFFALILLPPVLGIAIKWSTVGEVLNDSQRTGRALSAIWNSFTIALIVSALDILAGIPMAWLISRGKSKWLNVLDTFVDIPFIVPTAALGYSLLLFWSKPEDVSSLFTGGLISQGWLLSCCFILRFPILSWSE